MLAALPEPRLLARLLVRLLAILARLLVILARLLARLLVRCLPIFTDFSDFLGRLHASDDGYSGHSTDFTDSSSRITKSLFVNIYFTLPELYPTLHSLY